MTRLTYTNRAPLIQVQPDEPLVIAEGRLASGMNSYLDPSDLANGVLSLALNAEVKGDRTSRTVGSVAISPAKPNSNKVLLYTGWKRFSGSTEYLRFTKNSVHQRSGVSWTALTGTLSGGDTDRIRWMTAADATTDYFFFTNGVDEIQSVDLSGGSFADLGANAPKCKYICGFFNRVVAAHYTEASPNPIMIGWSGDLNFTEWDPLVDISAGSTPLMEAQADFSDGITGIFGFAAVMLILRERSLWTATKRPVASNPFAFTAAFPSVGCDTPSSATQTRNGICWYDFRTNQVYVYEVGSRPIPVGDPIRDLLKSTIVKPTLVSASYNTQSNTYILTVPSENTSTTRIFKFNLENQCWTYDEKEDVYSAFFIDGGARKLKINELVGKINNLQGKINDLSATTLNQPAVFYGMTDGEIEESSSNISGGTLTLRSKIFRLPKDDLMITRLMLLIEPLSAGSISVYYRKNGGDWTLYKTTPLASTLTRQRIYCTKLLRCNDYQWGISISSGNAAILEFKIEAIPSGEDK